MLVGRDRERQVVDQLVAGARIGDGGVLAITGEAGVGKTSLLDYAASRLQGLRLLRATGTETERGIGFAGLHSVLRPLLPLLGRIPAPQAAALSGALALAPGTVADRFSIGAATLSLLCQAAEDGPVAVVVDDMQLWDRPSAEALAFAARRIGSDSVLVLLSGRTGECEEVLTGLPVMSLAGLDAAASHELVGARLGVRLTDEHVARLHAATGGNPLALLELGHDLDALVRTGPGLPPPVPARLVDSFTRRLGVLGPESRAALLVAVVTGGDPRLSAVACRRLGLGVHALAAAQEAGLVSITLESVAFRHPLLRAAVYAAAGPEDRAQVHRAVAELLPPEQVDRRAWHLAEASSEPDAEVALMLEGVAERAVSRSAYAPASAAYERSARLSPAPEDHLLRLTRAAGLAWEAGMGEHASGLLDELAPLELRHDALASMLRIRAQIVARTGSLLRARDMLERAAEAATSTELRIELLADAERASMHLADGSASRRLAAALERETAGARSLTAKAVGLTACGMAKVLTGSGGAEEIRAAIPLLATSQELHHDPGRQVWLMLALLFLREEGTGAELRRMVDQTRHRVGVGTLPSLLVYVARDQAAGHSWARAEANFAEAARLARETGQTTELAMSLAGLTWLEARRGRVAQCHAWAEEALPLCERHQVRLGELWVHFARGDLALADGRPQRALVHLRRLDERITELGLGDVDVSPAPELVDVLLRVGNRDEAASLALGHLARAREKGRPWALARAHRALGLVASEEGIDEPFATALRLHSQTPDDFETARTRLAYGVRLRRAGRRVDAREQLRPALALFAELGAALWADGAAAELAATGETVTRRDPAGVDGLTPQELQVSLLLADGRTTRETAAALFLSPKTVEYHLRKVYTKLGIRSRAELADRLPGD